MRRLKFRPSMIALIVLSIAMPGYFACEGSGPTAEAAGDTGTNEQDGTDTSGPSGSSSDTGNSSQSTETDTCATLDLSLERQPVTIMLAIDRSASMDLQLGDNDTRWSVVVKALMGTVDDPDSGLVWSMEDQVNFGMVLFTAERNKPDTCPMLESVSPALNNGSAVASIFKADDDTYKGASPVPEGIDEATRILTDMDDSSEKVILLATDGLPQTCDTLAESDNEEAEAAVVDAVQAAYSEGITTFVVGVGDEDDETAAHFQEVANAGAGLDPEGSDTAVYYQGSTENSLIDAISSVITEEAVSCIYELDGKGVADGEASSGTVLLDGEALTLDDEENGWRLKSSSEIELLGAACEAIQVGDHHLEADFPCESIVLIV